MERSTDAVELLDGPLDDPSALTGNLRDLRRVNRWLGGASLTAPAIEALAAHRPELTLLDVGTGGADIPVDLLARAARRSRRLVDRGHRQPARGPGRGRRWPRPRWRRRPASSSTSATAWPCPTPIARSTSPTPRWCSITWTVDEAVRLIREMARVARLGVVVNDLERSRLGWIGAWLMAHLLTGNRYTRHDAPLSVRRSYRAVEMAALLRDAGTIPVKTVRGAMGQRYAIAALSTQGRHRLAGRPGHAARPDRGRRMTERLGVAIVGGGPAGAALAARLAAVGQPVVVLERSAHWQWRAGGVFASPAAVSALRRIGSDAALLREVARPIPAMRVETPAGATFRLTYGADAGGEPAVGFDRSRLDPSLLELAARAGAEIRRGWSVTAVDLDDGAARRPTARRDAGDPRRRGHRRRRRAAFGRREGRRRGPPGPPRSAHRVDLPPARPGPGRAPRRADAAPARRLCRDRAGRRRPGQHRDRARSLVARRRSPATAPGPSPTRSSPRSRRPTRTRRAGAELPPTDELAGAWPLGHRVTRRAGRRWLLVGDAAGFLDPFTGEGIHRALVSAELAAGAICATARGRTGAFAAYERAMQRRFLAKDAVSWLVQAFLGRPSLFEYAARRVAARPAVRATMGLVMGDLVPAGRALDPRYLAALLAP